MTTYKQGDRVVGAGSWCFRKVGSVAKVGRGRTATILWDGAEKEERVDLNKFRLETQQDKQRSAAAAAMDAWRESRPETNVAHVEYGRSYSTSNEPRGVELRSATTPEAMRIASRELLLLADWFEKRPVS